MTTTTASRPRATARRGVALRVALIVVAALAVALSAPVWLRAPLSIAAALMTAEAVVRRHRHRGVIDAGLLAAGGGAVLLALLGLVLGLLPSGLSDGGWALGVGLLQLAVLAATARRPAPAPAAPRPSRRAVLAAVGWSAAVAGVLAAAVLWSTASYTATHVAPVALAATQADGRTVVSVTAGAARGPFRLELVTAEGRSVLARDLRVAPDAAASVALRLPAGTRGLVQLVPAGAAAPVRELILDSTAPGARR